jgi:hypothetical protein
MVHNISKIYRYGMGEHKRGKEKAKNSLKRDKSVDNPAVEGKLYKTLKNCQSSE